jgi:MADS-box transcription factor
MFQSLSAEIDRVKKENDNMQIELRPVFLFKISFQFLSSVHVVILW